MAYDPVKLAKTIEPRVAPLANGVRLRRYYRFRRDRWYGGVATGDVVGCNLRCKFCWAWRYTWTGYDRGVLLTAEEAAEKLVGIARRSGVSQVRLSGGEPTIGWEHMVSVAEYVTSEGLNFILETNGILVAVEEALARRLASFHGAGIEVRVSLKGTSPEELHRLTGATPDAWSLQIEAIRRLVEYGLEPCEEVYAAVMLSFTDEKGVTRVKRILSSIDARLARCIDPEYVILYPHVVELLRRTGLRPRVAYKPGEIPPELV